MKIRRFFVVCAAIAVFALALAACPPGPDVPQPITITSPYSSINWTSFGQYKAGLHVHTSVDGGVNPPWEMIEDHYAKGYDIVAITDHDFVTPDWININDGLEQDRYYEILSGSDRDGRGMLQIPYTNEQSVTYEDHLCSFFTNYKRTSTDEYEDVIRKVQELDGICHINHPGRFTNGFNDVETGNQVSNDPVNINKYVDLFMKYPNCAGMEIINKKDYESAADRILWDNILKVTIPQNRYVWGFSSDDTHNADNTGYSFNVFLMPSNTLINFRKAFLSGNFYAVAKVSKRELGYDFVASGPTPVIKSITVDNSTITITAENFDKIEWISDGVVLTTGITTNAVGATINIEECANVGCYVRANISGLGGIAFTQPFGIKKNR